jgi:hypothetical protein
VSDRSFFVRGRDKHERYIREFDCSSPLDAAREYLIGYVEDWRGGYFKRLDLDLFVWTAKTDENAADRWRGSVIASGHERTAQEFTYTFVKAE